MKREDEVQAAVVSGLTKAQAEEVLVGLENHRCTGLAVTVGKDDFIFIVPCV